MKENIFENILENSSVSCLETKMINDHRPFYKVVVADILAWFPLYKIIANFERLTLRLYGANVIYYAPFCYTDILSWKQRASVRYLEQLFY